MATRQYATVLPAMADRAGLGQAEVSRATVVAGTRVLRELAARDRSELDALVVYLDETSVGLLESLVTRGQRAGVRGVAPGAALQKPKTAERAGPSATGAAGADTGDVAGGREAGRRRAAATRRTRGCAIARSGRVADGARKWRCGGRR